MCLLLLRLRLRLLLLLLLQLQLLRVSVWPFFCAEYLLSFLLSLHALRWVTETTIILSFTFCLISGITLLAFNTLVGISQSTAPPRSRKARRSRFSYTVPGLLFCVQGFLTTHGAIFRNTFDEEIDVVWGFVSMHL